MPTAVVRDVKAVVRWTYYRIVNLFIQPSREIKRKTLLIVRLDAIGDYILFRNFIEEIKNSQQYQGYHIDLLGNEAWESIALELDKNYIKRFIWIDRIRFSKNPLYRIKKLNEITAVGYEILISPTYSRDFFFNDEIIRLVSAKTKIGNYGDTSNMRKWQKQVGDSYYDRLIDTGDDIVFEFNRNRAFFEAALGASIENLAPKISLSRVQPSLSLPDDFALLFVGVSHESRRWSIERFAEIGRHLHAEYGYHIVLCGGPGDVFLAKEFDSRFKDTYTNLVGKTSLVEFLYIVSRAKVLVSNDTSAPHFAAAVGGPEIFIIYNGKNFGRFVPYPEESSSKVNLIYHPKIAEDIDRYKNISNDYGYVINLDINDISIDQVKESMGSVLSQSALNLS